MKWILEYVSEKFDICPKSGTVADGWRMKL